ncbi:MAG: hypothetical protein KGL39_42030 [Patescibacteria group bacterium]|nr:hypothetical protein [Patescibacteria group bacterium]
MPETKWPESVPILSARDICRNEYKDDQERRCLIGWLCYSCRWTIYKSWLAIREEIERATGRGMCLAEFNDNPRFPKKLIAQVWNRAMARLGYTEGNPEGNPDA